MVANLFSAKTLHPAVGAATLVGAPFPATTFRMIKEQPAAIGTLAFPNRAALLLSGK